MLENTDLTDEASLSTHFAPLKVVLPEELLRFYAERGYLASMPREERTKARLNVRAKGFIRFLPTLPSLHCEIIASDTRQGTILIKDISKSGIAILYHRQVFPCEQFEIFIYGRVMEATAVRCRRIGPKCYETGASVSSIASAEDNGSTIGA